MPTRNEPEVQPTVARADNTSHRSDLPFVSGLDEWNQWRAQKLQDVRRQIAATTRLTHKHGPANRARVATRG